MPVIWQPGHWAGPGNTYWREVNDFLQVIKLQSLTSL